MVSTHTSEYRDLYHVVLLVTLTVWSQLGNKRAFISTHKQFLYISTSSAISSEYHQSNRFQCYSFSTHEHNAECQRQSYSSCCVQLFGFQIFGAFKCVSTHLNAIPHINGALVPNSQRTLECWSVTAIQNRSRSNKRSLSINRVICLIYFCSLKKEVIFLLGYCA